VDGRLVAVEQLGRTRFVAGRVVAVERLGLASLAAAELDGERVLVPVTMSGPWAAIGRAVTVEVPLQAMTDLRAERFGPQVRLRWQWPRWAQDERVAWRVGTPPASPLDPEAQSLD